MSLNQTEFLNAFHSKLEAKGWNGLRRVDIKELFDTIEEVIVEELKKKPVDGKNFVVVKGVGRFTRTDKPRRKGPRPFTDPPEMMWYPAKKSVRVTPQASIRKILNPVKK